MRVKMGIDGFLIVDKAEGITSLDVVREVKRRLGVRKAGHVGTLDPFATGVLPVALNEGTKLIPFLSEEPKRYEGTLKLGEETTTDDLTGGVVSKKPWAGVTEEALQTAFQSFSGRIHQIPPMFSAIKVAGKPLYRLARKGLVIDRKEREAHILHLQIEELDLPRVRFRVSCSKGTYIRALAKDIGRRIGCGAHLAQLRRVQSGLFSIEKAMAWEHVKTLETGSLRSWLLPLEEALPNLPEVIGDKRLIRRIRSGQGMLVRDLSPQSPSEFDQGNWIKITAPEEGLVAILKSEVKHSDVPWTNLNSVVFRPLRVFRPRG
ncbi:MAG: tRNA pseudouridine(55) synthase TruB [Deltaproteobacteria bacterium RBG_16_48_10]|nr:MAG: tRNA pseudouridine(55) synthase TruB [Deltaproteobacteria bacterium RBG_16_48_10]